MILSALQRNLIRSAACALLPICLAWPQVLCAQDSTATLTEITFEKASVNQESREGYVTLEWQTVPDATRYEVIDEQGTVVFSGGTSKAFLSGLDNGTYRFQLRAYDKFDSLIAESSKVAEVEVQHWPMQLVGLLFFIGLAVVLAVAGVLIIGARVAETESSEGGLEAAQS